MVVVAIRGVESKGKVVSRGVSHGRRKKKIKEMREKGGGERIEKKNDWFGF